jgi:hypothetical protein
MRCKINFKKLVSFGLAFLLGLLADSFNKAQEILNRKDDFIKIQEKTVYKNIYVKQGRGFSGACYGNEAPKFINYTPVKRSDPRNKPLHILSKPRPLYTAEARENNTQGKITLRVAFLANGEIGNISPINKLPDGLTEQAITAAKQMKFEPQIKNGTPQTVIKSVQFSFTIY